MKKIQIVSAIVLTSAAALSARADDATSAPGSASTALSALESPMNIAPAGISQEKFYSVQDRYSRLAKRFEISAGGGNNFTASSFLVSRQADVGARYHFTNRWSLAASWSYVSNTFTESTKALITQKGSIPDLSYVKTRYDLLLGYNLFYGKFRLGMDRVLYFDQYWAIGPGQVETQYKTATAGVIDAGFAFWIDHWGSVRVGLKNWIYQDQRLLESALKHDLVGRVEIGYLFGNGG